MKKVAVGVAAVLVVLMLSPARGLVVGFDRPSSARTSDHEQVLGATAERLRDSPLDGDGAEFAGSAEAAATPRPGEVAILPPPASFGANAVRAPATPPPVQIRSNRFDGVVPSGGTWAVMIGINDYPGNQHDLRSAVADADDVNAALGQMGVPGSQRLLLKDGNATAANIRTSAQWLVAHAGKDATAVFFYAGHIRRLGGGTEAIVGSDGGVVTDADLAKLLDKLQAAKTWIGLAGCYAGGFTEVVRPGRILTAAAPYNSLAYENSEFGRSYLVEYMVRRAMLNGPTTTVETAFNLAEQGIQRDFPERMPVQFDAYEGNLDLRPASSAAPAATPPPSSSSSGGAPPSDNSSSPPPPSSPTTTAPPSTTSSGGSNAPPPKNDGCSTLTNTIVRCGT